MTSRSRKAPDPAEVDGLSRVLADIPTPVYQSVKVECVERGISMKRYVLELLQAAGHPKKKRYPRSIDDPSVRTRGRTDE